MAHPVATRSRRLTPAKIRDLLLVGLAFTSGAIDAISYLALGKVFTAFMTGNIVFLGLRLADTNVQDLIRVSVALGAFAAGSFAAVKLVNPTMGSGIWPRRVSITLGVAALVQLVFLALWIAVSGRPANGTGTGDVLTGLYGLAMGMQTGAVVSLGLRAVFTTAATATVVNLMGDMAGWPLSTRDRGRFAGVLLGLVTGVAAGALLIAHARTFAPVLPLVTSVLVIVVARRTISASAES